MPPRQASPFRKDMLYEFHTDWFWRQDSSKMNAGTCAPRRSWKIPVLNPRQKISKRRQTCANASLQGGYISIGTGNNAMEVSIAFANLAQATEDDCASVTNMTTVNSTFTEQVAMYTNQFSAKEA